MTRGTTGGMPRISRVILALTLMLAALFAWQAATAQAVPMTQEWIGDQPATPDLERSDLRYFNPSGPGGSPDRPDGVPDEETAPYGRIGASGTINLSLDGRPVVAYCVDISRGLATTAPIPVDVVEQSLADADTRAMLWILLNATPTGPETPEKSTQGSVGQIATWVLLGQLHPTAPTDDPTINAAVLDLIGRARAETATPRTLAVSASTPAAGGLTSTITVTGKPGAVVQLAVTGGTGTLSAGSVTIGAGGTATALLTATGPGSVTVTATTAGDGTLFRINPQDRTQATQYGQPSQLTAATTATFAAGQQVTPPTTPGVTPVGRPAPVALRISKAAPGTARPLGLVRYTIVVRNRTARTANRVVLRDRIPAGMSFVRASRSARVVSGQVVVSLGNMRAGSRRVVVIWMRANSSVRGQRTNVAVVRGANVRPASARAVTRFRPLVRRIQPAVTG